MDGSKNISYLFDNTDSDRSVEFDEEDAIAPHQNLKLGLVKKGKDWKIYPLKKNSVMQRNIMATLTINNLPNDLMAKLQQLATQNNQTLNEIAIFTK